jgi:hypothetical protein
MGWWDDAQGWLNGTEFFPQAQPPQVGNGAGAVNAAVSGQRAAAVGDDGSLRSARGELERAGIDPQSMEGYEAIERYARERLKQTMTAPAMTNAEKIGGVLQNIGGVWAHAQNNPQVGQSLLSNNYLTQHSKAAQDHRGEMSKLNSTLAMNTASNFDKYYTGTLEERRKLKLAAQEKIRSYERAGYPVPPSLYKAAGLPPDTGPPQTPQGGPPSGTAPGGAPPAAPSGPLPEVPGVSVAPPDPSNMATPLGMPPIETGAAPAPAPQPSAAPTSPQMTRLEAARNNPAAMDAFKKAQISFIEGDKEAGNAHMKRFEQLSNLSSEEAEVLRGMDDPEFEKARLKGKRAGSSAAEPAYDAKMGGTLAEQFIKLQEAGGTASEAKGDLLIMKEMIKSPDVYMGTGGDQVQLVKKAAATLFGADFKGVPEAEVIQRTASKIALGMKDNLPGPMSDSDREFLLSLPPGLATTKEGSRRLVEIGLAQKEWKIKLAEASNQYVREHGRLDQGWFSVKAQIDAETANQIGGLARELQKQAQATQTSPTAGMEPTVKSNDDYKALPPGSFFLTPDGRRKQKPMGPPQ